MSTGRAPASELVREALCTSTASTLTPGAGLSRPVNEAMSKALSTFWSKVPLVESAGVLKAGVPLMLARAISVPLR